MISQSKLEPLLEELLGEDLEFKDSELPYKPSWHSSPQMILKGIKPDSRRLIRYHHEKGLILDNPEVTEESVRDSYGFLKDISADNKEIADNVGILSLPLEILKSNYRKFKGEDISDIAKPSPAMKDFLKSFKGLSDEAIAYDLSILWSFPGFLLHRYDHLRRGLSLRDADIASNPVLFNIDMQTLEARDENLEKFGLIRLRLGREAFSYLLTMDPDTLQERHENLEKLGLSNSSIAYNSALLNQDSETINRNYDLLGGVLRDDYQDRESGRKLILKYASLLAKDSMTIESNVQFLHSLRMDPRNHLSLLGNAVQDKREKMAWMLRELFDYREMPSEKKVETVHNMRHFVRDNPRLLAYPYTVKSLERRKDELREIAAEYLK